MSLPSVFRPCEGCRNVVALVDHSELVCAKLGRLENVTFCRAYEKEDPDVLSDYLLDRVRDRPSADRMEGRE